MYKDKRFAAIVLAAGTGSRMKSDKPKQYMDLGNREVLYYSLAAFSKSVVDEIILVVGENDIEFCREKFVDEYGFSKISKIVPGGSERYLSVQNGLGAVTEADYVMIHDGARPCITETLITNLMDEVIINDACTLGVPVKDTIKVVDANNVGVSTPDRKTLWQVQTPQCFVYEEIKSAYACMQKELEKYGQADINITDDTMIMERFYNRKSKLIMGDYRNIKITTPEDISVAKIFLEI
ncbi:MAG: 2-C-methyl-D-erythritol 4-phosphate cytidylyltransferase [Lachnospiraceae bacterium]|nr:2-C-methyl-D-erythritol 4-phosphate cytidylyltransferase [Lachnospiraceae bacterium]